MSTFHCLKNNQVGWNRWTWHKYHTDVRSVFFFQHIWGTDIQYSSWKGLPSLLGLRVWFPSPPYICMCSPRGFLLSTLVFFPSPKPCVVGIFNLSVVWMIVLVCLQWCLWSCALSPQGISPGVEPVTLCNKSARENDWINGCSRVTMYIGTYMDIETTSQK